MLIHPKPSPTINSCPKSFPVTTQPPAALNEPSLADAIAHIAQSEALRPEQRAHWICSIRFVARVLDRAPSLIPGRWMAVRPRLEEMHPSQLGVTPKTFANHRANLRVALNLFCAEKNVPRRGTPLSEPWSGLWVSIDRLPTRKQLSRFLRYLSANGISPEAVDDAVVEAFLGHCEKTGLKGPDLQSRRRLVRAWNDCSETIPGWPVKRLNQPPVRSVARGPDWEAFPARVRDEVDAFLASKAPRKLSFQEPTAKVWAPTTRRAIFAKLQACARMAVRRGVAIETLDSLSALLDPLLVERVLNGYWEQDGEEPRTYTIDLARDLLAVARETGAVDSIGLERLAGFARRLREHKRGGLTDKNMAIVRQVQGSDVWSSVVRLPYTLMDEARRSSDTSPTKAAIKAQLATAIGILVYAPIRLQNLIAIRLGENLFRTNGPDTAYWLRFPDHDVKNRVALEFLLQEPLAALIAEYVHEHLPVLARGSNAPWLFPGEDGRHKRSALLGLQITAAVKKRCGLRLTPHQFRHAAGTLILDKQPGNYELARRVLGHRSMRTTVQAYCGLETTQATAIFGDIVSEKLRDQFSRDSR
jgi:integrase